MTDTPTTQGPSQLVTQPSHTPVPSRLSAIMNQLGKKWTPVPSNQLQKDSGTASLSAYSLKAATTVNASVKVLAATTKNNDEQHVSNNATTDKDPQFSKNDGPSSSFHIRTNFGGPIHFGVPIKEVVITSEGRSRIFPSKKITPPPPPMGPSQTMQQQQSGLAQHPFFTPSSPNPISLQHFFNSSYIKLIEDFLDDKHAQVNIVVTNNDGEPHVKVTHNHFLAPTTETPTPLKTY